MSARDRIGSIRIQGMRCLHDVDLRLEPGLTVLVGENGTGKSSLVEACELLRKAGDAQFTSQLGSVHGGLQTLLGEGEQRLELELRADGDDGPLTYVLAVAQRGSAVIIERERLDQGHDHLTVIERSEGKRAAFVPAGGKPAEFADVAADQPLLAAFGVLQPNPAIARMRRLLEGIEVHQAFDASPYWLTREQRRAAPLRDANVLERTARLVRPGLNLANAFHALRNDLGPAHWRETLDWVRLGLGPELEDVSNPADASGGRIGLALKWRHLAAPVPAFGISDGTLAFLSFVAAIRLGQGRRSLLVFDEPETHLHPALLGRVLSFLEVAAADHPVLLSTHSERLLDALDRPQDATRVCELDEAGRTRLRRLDAEALGRWLERYRGLGDLASAGFLPRVLAEEPR